MVTRKPQRKTLEALQGLGGNARPLFCCAHTIAHRRPVFNRSRDEVVYRVRLKLVLGMGPAKVSFSNQDRNRRPPPCAAYYRNNGVSTVTI